MYEYKVLTSTAHACEKKLTYLHNSTPYFISFEKNFASFTSNPKFT